MLPEIEIEQCPTLKTTVNVQCASVVTVKCQGIFTVSAAGVVA